MTNHKNTLYPIFLKAEQLNFLIVGGGDVALEKLTFLLKSSPGARVTVVAKEIKKDVFDITNRFENVELIKREYRKEDLEPIDILIVAINDRKISKRIRQEARSKRILINVADKPDECDFYLGSIVTKGDLKIAISTNGKSPTLAKRIRQWLEDELPNELESLIKNLNQYRTNFNSFGERVRNLNAITESLIKKKIKHV